MFRVDGAVASVRRRAPNERIQKQPMEYKRMVCPRCRSSFIFPTFHLGALGPRSVCCRISYRHRHSFILLSRAASSATDRPQVGQVLSSIVHTKAHHHRHAKPRVDGQGRTAPAGLASLRQDRDSGPRRHRPCPGCLGHLHHSKIYAIPSQRSCSWVRHLHGMCTPAHLSWRCGSNLSRGRPSSASWSMAAPSRSSSGRRPCFSASGLWPRTF